jgi:hypothetical protein
MVISERHRISNSTASIFVDITTSGLDQNAMDEIALLNLDGIEFGDCPATFSCRSAGCLVVAYEVASDRTKEVYYFGFDNILMATLTQLVVTSMDEWPAMAHPLTSSGSAYAWLVWPFFALMATFMGLVVANMYVSVICFAMTSVDPDRDNSAATQRLVKKLSTCSSE